MLIDEFLPSDSCGVASICANRLFISLFDSVELEYLS